MLWSGGIMLLGFAALRWGVESPAQHPRTGNLASLLFWLGPLSPPLLYGALLVVGVLDPPLPPDALLAGAALAVVLAARIYANNHVTNLLAEREEAQARRAEQARILGELHDGAKQSIHAASIMVNTCLDAQEANDPGAVRDLLEKAREACRDAGRRLSAPMDGLRFSLNEAPIPTEFFRERFEKFADDFGLRAHEDLRVPLEVLSNPEVALAHRVVVEAAWNAAKHAQARNLYLESRLEGDAYVLEVRDDGRGFAPEGATYGLGIGFMRSRAEEAGAGLEIVSAPGSGTTVRLTFEKGVGK